MLSFQLVQELGRQFSRTIGNGGSRRWRRWKVWLLLGMLVGGGGRRWCGGFDWLVVAGFKRLAAFAGGVDFHASCKLEGGRVSEEGNERMELEQGVTKRVS